MNPRMERARQIMSTKGYCSQIDQDNFSVRSQTNPENRYKVSKTGNGLICECKDHTTRKADCKHIKIVLDVIKKNQCKRNNTFRIIERSLIKVCKYCDSGNIKKWGMRKSKQGDKQSYKCLDCKKRFTANFGFEKMRYNQRTITHVVFDLSLSDRDSKGLNNKISPPSSDANL